MEGAESKRREDPGTAVTNDSVGKLRADQSIHEPARLMILTVLTACEQADFLFLERTTGLSRGDLSVQLGRPEETGLIRIAKTIQRKRTHTMVALADSGRLALETYWHVMAELREHAGQAGAGRAAASTQVGGRLPLPEAG